MANEPPIARRKADHLEVAASGRADASRSTLLEHVHLIHQSLPELSVDDIDLTTELVGKKLAAPLVITGMTGGTAEAGAVNRDLARAAQAAGIALGLGSQRAMAEHPELIETYEVRSVAPDVVLFGNVGAVQALAMGPGKVIELGKRIGADAMCVHLNPGQELIQEHGDRDFRGLVAAIARLVEAAPFPIIVKETGCGLSPQTARALGQRYRARDRAGCPRRRHGRTDAARTASRRRRRRARGDRSRDARDPLGLSAHRFAIGLRSREGAAPCRCAAACVPR